jgi:hypothetical protein
MPIHTIGDSHSMFGWRNIPGVIVHHIGPKLAFSVGRDGLAIPPEFGIQGGDTVVFSFGEIDCRCHIHKHVTPETSYMEIIDSIVSAYIGRILELSASLPGVRCCIYNVVPPVQRHMSAENKQYPFLGSDEERRSYTLYFNAALAAACVTHGFTFVDIYDAYATPEKYLNRAHSDGHVHIRDAGYIIDFARAHLSLDF